MRSPSCPRRPARARRYAAAPAAAVRGRPHDLAACGQAKLNGMDLSACPPAISSCVTPRIASAGWPTTVARPCCCSSASPNAGRLPTALTRATEIKRLLGADAGKLRVLFITVDPERDTLKS